MERAKKLIECLKNFNKWSLGGSSTQVTATASEDFCEQCVKKGYPNSKVYKMGSQQHPDFMVVPDKYEEQIEKFKKAMKKRKITLGVLRNWEASPYNKDKIRIVRIEIKTGASVYTLNDTFPSPSRKEDEIYVLFSIGEQKVYVTTSSTMAEKCKTNPPIEKRFEASKKAVSDFGSHLKKIWDGIGISTAARPTYRMDRNYAHHETSAERVGEIFAEAGF